METKINRSKFGLLLIVCMLAFIGTANAATGWDWSRYKIGYYGMDSRGMSVSFANPTTGAVLSNNCSSVYFLVTDKAQIASLLSVFSNGNFVSLNKSGQCNGDREILTDFFVYP